MISAVSGMNTKVRGKTMSDYLVLVTLSQEAISLGAESKEEAIKKAKAIIAEEYGESVANDATYETKGEEDV